MQFNRTVSQFSGLNFDLNLASLDAYYGNHICGDNTESIALKPILILTADHITSTMLTMPFERVLARKPTSQPCFRLSQAAHANSITMPNV